MDRRTSHSAGSRGNALSPAKGRRKSIVAQLMALSRGERLRRLACWIAGLLMALCFFPPGALWLVLGSLAYFPLRSFVALRKERRERQLLQGRYLQMLESANVYFQDAYAVQQYLEAMAERPWPQDPAWKSKLRIAANSLQTGMPRHQVHQQLKDGLPRDAEFFLEALFGPAQFQEQLQEISLSSLQHYRQKLRLNLALEAELASQIAEATILAFLPFPFSLFLPGLLKISETPSLISTLLIIPAWFLCLGSIALILRVKQQLLAGESHREGKTQALEARLRRLPRLRLPERIWRRLVPQMPPSWVLEPFAFSLSEWRSRPEMEYQEAALEARLVEALLPWQSLGLLLGSLLALLSRNPFFLLLALLMPLAKILEIRQDSRALRQTMLLDFLAEEQKLYLYLLAGESLDNALRHVQAKMPQSALKEDWQRLLLLNQGGYPIVQLLSFWSSHLGIPEIQEAVALLQRYVESGSRESLLRLGEQILDQREAVQLKRQAEKSGHQSRILVPMVLDLLSIILICVIPALESFTQMGR